MPTISINKKYFYDLLGREMTDKEFDDIVFDYGLETEEDTLKPENIKVELPANRYDLLCVEGLVLSLSQYLKTKAMPTFTCQPHVHTMTVEESVKGIRPVGVSGIIRNVKFNEHAYNSFIDLQDKLHHNLGRRRTLVSIGTHDYDKTKPPYKYVAKKPEDFAFVPLNQEKKMNGKEMIQFYKEDLNLKAYVPIIENSEVIPLIMDSEDNILSMPPIINSELSKITLETRNIFIDITATDKTKALIALDVLLSSFSLYSETPFSFEQVKIIDAVDGDFICPETPLNKTMTVKHSYLENVVSTKLQSQQVIDNLGKMGLITRDKGDGLYEVDVPFYRSDVLHQCDIGEDLAIGFGYNNIPFSEPEIVCTGRQNDLNKQMELMRAELAFSGYAECLNFSLCSKEDLGAKLLQEEDQNAVVIGNPKTKDFQVGRTTLLPGLLKTLATNKKNKLPFKLFELGDVMLLKNDVSDEENIGAVNRRKLAAVYTDSNSANLDDIHGLLDMVMTKMFENKLNYVLKNGKKPYFLHQLQCEIYIKDQLVGEMGIVHPDVMKTAGIALPTSFMELDFEALVELRQAN